jgi:hypothetical protein
MSLNFFPEMAPAPRVLRKPRYRIYFRYKLRDSYYFVSEEFPNAVEWRVQAVPDMPNTRLVVVCVVSTLTLDKG